MQKNEKMQRDMGTHFKATMGIASFVFLKLENIKFICKIKV